MIMIILMLVFAGIAGYGLARVVQLSREIKALNNLTERLSNGESLDRIEAEFEGMKSVFAKTLKK